MADEVPMHVFPMATDVGGAMYRADADTEDVRRAIDEVVAIDAPVTRWQIEMTAARQALEDAQWEALRAIFAGEVSPSGLEGARLAYKVTVAFSRLMAIAGRQPEHGA